MNRIAISCAIVLASSAAYVYAGAPPAPSPALEPATNPTTSVQADAGSEPRKDENVVISADVGKPRVVADTGCVRESGTRIRRAPDANGCNGQPGSAYTRGDLDSTGQANTADALKRLDTRL